MDPVYSYENEWDQFFSRQPPGFDIDAILDAESDKTALHLTVILYPYTASRLGGDLVCGILPLFVQNMRLVFRTCAHSLWRHLQTQYCKDADQARGKSKPQDQEGQHAASFPQLG